MPTNAKWTRNSGLATNRNVGTTRLKGDGGQIKPVDLVNGKVYNGYALNVEGSNLVLGLGTSAPFSRLSFGNNTNSGIYDINDTGQLSSIALNETSSGGKFSGFFFSSDIKKYYQPIGLTDISTNGIQIMTTDLNSFNIKDNTGGLFFITNENVTTIGGQPRVGINEGNSTEIWRGVDIGDNPNNYSTPSRDGQTKIVLDVRGSIRTDGYINFFYKYYDNTAGINSAKFAPAPAFWDQRDSNIPVGSLWLQPTAGLRGEGLWFKNSSGDVQRVEATSAGDTEKVDRNEALSLDMFNFLFRSDDYLNTTSNPAGKFTASSGRVDYPYVILKGRGSGQGKDGFVGGTSLNIRGGSAVQLSDIIHEKGYNDGSQEKEICSITQGNLTVTGLSGEEFLIKPHNVNNIQDNANSLLIHPMKTFWDHHGLLQNDMSGGKIWCERQLLIGSKKSEINWALIDIQTTPNSPTLLSYNLDKNWTYNTNADKRNRRFITQRATNSIILLNKGQNNQGHTSGNCSVGELYDCSNSIIIGDVFKNLDVPKSLIINVNSSLDDTLGQEIYDDTGGNIISGHKNQIYKSPYCFVIGEENFIQNNTNTVIGLGSNIISGKKNEIWGGIYNFITGYYNRNQGNYNRIGGTNNIIGFYSEDQNGDPINPTSKRGSSSDDFNKRHFNNTIFGSYNCIGLQTTSTSGSGVNTAFISGHSNTIEEYSTEGNKIAPIALGSQAYVGGDIRFAIGVYDNTPSINSKATSTNHSNKFVIDKNGYAGIGTSSPQLKLDVHGDNMGRRNITGTCHDADKRNSFKIGRWDGPSIDNDFLGIELKVDTTTNMGYGSADNQTAIIFQTWGNSYAVSREVMRIRGDGNVGIGEDSPNKKLHIKGDGEDSTAIKIESTNSSGPGFMYIQRNKDGKAYVLNHSNHALILGTNNTSQLYLKEDGNVGIGINNPESSLQVSGTVMDQPVTKGIHMGMNLNASDAYIKLASASNGSCSIDFNKAGEASSYNGSIYYSFFTNRMEFYTNKYKRMVLDEAGLGIGTDESSSALSIVGSIGTGLSRPSANVSKGIHLGMDTNNAIINLCASDWHDYSIIQFSNVSHTDQKGAIQYDHYNNYMQFYVNNDTEALRLMSNGDVFATNNVGIGTSSPDYKLSVSNGGIILINSDSNYGSGARNEITTTVIDNEIHGNGGGLKTDDVGFLRLSAGGGTSTGNKSYIDLYGYNSNLITFGTKGAERMVIDNVGNVGIGIDSPQAPLHIYKDSDGNNTITEILRLQRHADDLSSSDKAEGGYISLLSTDDSPSTCEARISWRGDNANNYENDSRIDFWTANNGTLYERVTINHDGYVGIGTPSPGVKLEVNGTIKAQSEFTCASSHHLCINSPNEIWFQADGSTMMRMKADGKFGIACSPTELLDVNGTMRFQSFIKNQTGYHMHIQSTNNIYFQHNTTTKMTLSAAGTGRLGIGCSPASALHVVGGWDTTPAKGIHMGAENDACIEISAASTSYSSYIDFTCANNDRKARILCDLDQSNLKFSTNNSYRMTISNTGKVDVVGELEAGNFSGNFPYDKVTGPFLTVGLICMWASSTLPTNWLWMNGSTLAKSTYPSLAAYLGQTGTHFQLPNMSNRYPRANSDMGNQAHGTGGSETITTENMPSHHHYIDLNTTTTTNTHMHEITEWDTAQNSTSHRHTIPAVTTGHAGNHNHIVEEISFGGSGQYGVIWGGDGGTDSNAVHFAGQHTHSLSEWDTAFTSANHGHTIPAKDTNNNSHNHTAEVKGHSNTTGDGDAFQPVYFRTNYIIYCGPVGT